MVSAAGSAWSAEPGEPGSQPRPAVPLGRYSTSLKICRTRQRLSGWRLRSRDQPAARSAGRPVRL
jgi:hypothetical protein